MIDLKKLKSGFVLFWVLAVLILSPTGTLFADDHSSVGVLVLHGKGGIPEGHVGQLVLALKASGYRVLAPSMPWARGRIYDASYADSLQMIQGYIQTLRKEGAQTIVLIGHSLGANVALGYAGVHPKDLNGLVLLAPGHYPENSGDKLSDDLGKAEDLVKKGKVDQTQDFSDVNMGKFIDVRAKPGDYLSFCDPQGPAAMHAHVWAFHQSLPVLVVSEAAPRNDPKGIIYDHLPVNGLNQFIRSNASHVDVPDATKGDVLKWLEKVEAAASVSK